MTSLIDNRRKVVAEEDVGYDSDIDIDKLIMIDEGLTQLEVRLEEGSRTIAIPMDNPFVAISFL